jgi:hypothetical protein
MGGSHAKVRTATLRQFLMVMAAVTWFAVLLPVGARAAGSLVTLVDSSTTHKARVDATNTLTVATRPATSSTWYYALTGPGQYPLFKPPAGRTKLAISTLTWSNPAVVSYVSALQLFGNLDCTTNFIHAFEFVTVPASDTVTVSFPQPLLIGPGGSNWCLRVGLSGPLDLTATGYYY